MGYGIQMIGGEHDTMYASEDGYLTKFINTAVVFKNSYYPHNLCFHWNKEDTCGGKWVTVEFYIDENGNLNSREY